MMPDTANIKKPTQARSGNKRKAVKVTRDMVAPLASIEPLNIKNLILKTEGTSRKNFIRLKYKGCPPLSKTGELISSNQYIDMARDDFVREMYRLFKPNFNETSSNHFNSLCFYIRWMDDSNYQPIEGDYFHHELINLYMQDWAKWVSQNKFSKGYWVIKKSALGFILRSLGRYQQAKRLPVIKEANKSTKPHKSIHVDSELKPTMKALLRGFNGFAEHIENGTTPNINPIWDEELFNKQVEKHSWQGTYKRAKTRAFKNSVTKPGDWRNQLTKIAAMLSFMFTGMNTSPLLKMKRKDVVFKQIHGGMYLFEAEKARSKHLEIDNVIGFSKYARGFIERWLSLSSKITGADVEAPLFPYVNLKGDIANFIQARRHPQTSINRLLGFLGLTQITPSILRKTKLDTLMKVTDDIYLVSIAGNNSISTLKQSYSSGLEQDHQRNLSASMEAQFDVAKGKSLTDAVSEAKYNHHDVLNEYEYKRLRKKEGNIKEARTPLGGRCQDNTKGAANIIDKMLKKSGVKMPEEEKKCTNFLECFECEYHKLVAAVDDIWLMLSFKDTLQEMQQYPSVNSLPESGYRNLCITIDSVLERFKDVSRINYLKALDKKKSASHPLYSSVYSLNDLLEVFS